ncbi:hypothetical protein EJ04DRAFT_516485 [Polyplosphaeria fusca]|uniref:Uncharacterized protein n=1 Tax=Polyplosphaeria fusca TaxID=682080 RepID=A0A9P4QPB6_9PLEO|nr:hypothetical protein EJ04DRAFT_516485 [Polyplosphaeria fusca]
MDRMWRKWLGISNSPQRRSSARFLQHRDAIERIWQASSSSASWVTLHASSLDPPRPPSQRALRLEEAPPLTECPDENTATQAPYLRYGPKPTRPETRYSPTMVVLASNEPERQPHRQSALAEIHYASVIDSDLTPSEDESPDEKVLQLEDAQSAIGVSIGQQQTRLTSPKTPAAEKAAALDDVVGGGLFDSWQQALDGTMEQSPRPHSSRPDSRDRAPQQPEQDMVRADEAHSSPPRLPSPWRARTQKLAPADHHRAALRDTLAVGHRRRALSGGSATDTLKKYMSFNLPSMPKSASLLNFSLPSFSVSSFDNARAKHSERVPPLRRITPVYQSSPYSRITQYDGNNLSRGEPLPANASAPRPASATSTSQTSVPNAPSPHIQRRPTPQLRRSNSEGSLLLYRSRSFASSLGDDSRFENIQEQVNSRLKAIKDSWQDSNFKLPSLPGMPNFSFGTREELFRSGSSSPRIDSTSALDRVSFLTNTTASMRAASTKLPKAREPSAGTAGMTGTSAISHPFFTQALRELSGDVVVLGGYRGSILRSAEPPHRQLWVPIKVGLNLRKVDLELGLDPEDEETEEERIIPAGMLTHIGPVDIAKRLFKRLRASDNAKNGSLRVHNYGYDWRLSPHILSKRLIEYLKSLPCNQPGTPPGKRGAVVIAHSLGGLVTRHAINQCPELVAGVVYAGVPRTCVNILGPLRKGDDVLLSSRVLTAQVNFTIRTSFALLPLDGKCFINKYTKEEYPVDFFDPQQWVDNHLSPCLAPALPAPNSTLSSNLSMSGLLSAMSQALPNLPGRKSSMSRPNGAPLPSIPNNAATSNGHGHSHVLRTAADSAANTAGKVAEASATQTAGVTPQMSQGQQDNSQSNPATAVTIPFDRAFAYLKRTLAETKAFKLELDFKPEHAESNAYPPIALIYGKSTPTVYGAKVESREAIKRIDAYDELAFASGDGVVLARAAMVPDGYSVVRGGVVSSDRGHVTLLGDLEAVGRCLVGVMEARNKGVGLGDEHRTKTKGKEKV